jgi:predicted nucleic acid-binding protein
MKALFDTNILIDYLLGKTEAKKEIFQHEQPYISIITKMEILVGASKDDEEIVRYFLNNFTIVDINQDISEIAISIRKTTKIKLSDAIIWACAKYIGSLLITRNTKDFPAHARDIVIPY